MKGGHYPEVYCMPNHRAAPSAIYFENQTVRLGHVLR